MKRRIYFILILSGLAINAYSQNTMKTVGDSIMKQTKARPLQQQPQFIGGATAYGAFLNANIHYPAQALHDKVEGRAIVTFVVEKDGSLSNLKLAIDPGSGLGDEAIRVLKLSPKWSPGMLDDQLVRVQYNVVVNFTLPKETR